MIRNCFISTLFILISLTATSQVVQLDSTTTTPLQISRQVSYFVDSTATLSLEEVSQQNFRPVKTDNFRLPFSDHAYWYRISLKNTGTGENKWYLAWDNNTMERIDFYAPDGGRYRKDSGGRLVAQSRRNYLGNNPYFAFELGDGQEKTIYLRARSQRGQRVRLILYEGSVFFSSKNQK